MGTISVNGRHGKFSESVLEMIVRFTGEVFPKLAEWERRLKVDPQTLDMRKRDVWQEFLRGAGSVIAGLMSVVMQTKEFAAATERARQNDSAPFVKGRDRTMSIQLLGGAMRWMASLYCDGLRRLGASDSVVGSHIEQSLFGIGKKNSPGIRSRRGWRAASHGSPPDFKSSSFA